MKISDELRSAAAQDIFTDAPECAESVSECRDTMDAAANVMDAMLAALKAYVADVGTVAGANNREAAFLERIEAMARAAIAKAEGETVPEPADATITKAETIIIAPSHEPKGEGNGWYECPEDEATQWLVFTGGPNGELIDAFDSREKAEAFVAEWKGRA